MADNRFSLPRLNSTEEDCRRHAPSDLVIPPTATLDANDENVYGLQFMANHRSLKSFQVGVPGAEFSETQEMHDIVKKNQRKALRALLKDVKEQGSP